MRAIYVMGKDRDFILSENGGMQEVNKNLMNGFMYAQRLEEDPATWTKEMEWRPITGEPDMRAAAEIIGEPLAYLTDELDYVSIDFETYRERMRHYTKEARA